MKTKKLLPLSGGVGKSKKHAMGESKNDAMGESLNKKEKESKNAARRLSKKAKTAANASPKNDEPAAKTSPKKAKTDANASPKKAEPAHAPSPAARPGKRRIKSMKVVELKENAETNARNRIENINSHPHHPRKSHSFSESNLPSSPSLTRSHSSSSRAKIENLPNTSILMQLSKPDPPLQLPSTLKVNRDTIPNQDDETSFILSKLKNEDFKEELETRLDELLSLFDIVIETDKPEEKLNLQLKRIFSESNTLAGNKAEDEKPFIPARACAAYILILKLEQKYKLLPPNRPITIEWIQHMLAMTGIYSEEEITYGTEGSRVDKDAAKNVGVDPSTTASMLNMLAIDIPKFLQGNKKQILDGPFACNISKTGEIIKDGHITSNITIEKEGQIICECVDIYICVTKRMDDGQDKKIKFRILRNCPKLSVEIKSFTEYVAENNRYKRQNTSENKARLQKAKKELLDYLFFDGLTPEDYTERISNFLCFSVKPENIDCLEIWQAIMKGFTLDTDNLGYRLFASGPSAKNSSIASFYIDETGVETVFVAAHTIPVSKAGWLISAAADVLCSSKNDNKGDGTYTLQKSDDINLHSVVGRFIDTQGPSLTKIRIPASLLVGSRFSDMLSHVANSQTESTPTRPLLNAPTGWVTMKPNKTSNVILARIKNSQEKPAQETPIDRGYKLAKKLLSKGMEDKYEYVEHIRKKFPSIIDKDELETITQLRGEILDVLCRSETHTEQFIKAAGIANYVHKQMYELCTTEYESFNIESILSEVLVLEHMYKESEGMISESFREALTDADKQSLATQIYDAGAEEETLREELRHSKNVIEKMSHDKEKMIKGLTDVWRLAIKAEIKLLAKDFFANLPLPPAAKKEIEDIFNELLVSDSELNKPSEVATLNKSSEVATLNKPSEATLNLEELKKREQQRKELLRIAKGIFNISKSFTMLVSKIEKDAHDLLSLKTNEEIDLKLSKEELMEYLRNIHPNLFQYIIVKERVLDESKSEWESVLVKNMSAEEVPSLEVKSEEINHEPIGLEVFLSNFKNENPRKETNLFSYKNLSKPENELTPAQEVLKFLLISMSEIPLFYSNPRIYTLARIGNYEPSQSPSVNLGLLHQYNSEDWILSLLTRTTFTDGGTVDSSYFSDKHITATPVEVEGITVFECGSNGDCVALSFVTGIAKLGGIIEGFDLTNSSCIPKIKEEIKDDESCIRNVVKYFKTGICDMEMNPDFKAYFYNVLSSLTQWECHIILKKIFENNQDAALDDDYRKLESGFEQLRIKICNDNDDTILPLLAKEILEYYSQHYGSHASMIEMVALNGWATKYFPREGKYRIRGVSGNGTEAKISLLPDLKGTHVRLIVEP